MGLILEEIEDKEEFDKLFLEITEDVRRSPSLEMSYPEIAHPSALLSNFEVRDDTKIIAAFRREQLAGLASFIRSKVTFLPPSFVNRVFFLLRRTRAKDVEDSLLERIAKAYSTLQIPEVSYIRLHPLEESSPSARRLGKHEYKKKFVMTRMARKLQNIPKPQRQIAPILRRVQWEEDDLGLFMRTWAQGFGWPAKQIEEIANGMTRRLLERNPSDPSTWVNFLAEVEGQAVGTAATLTFPDAAFVVNVSTLEESRRRGFAVCTMMNLMEWCKEQEMRYMALDVWPRDTAAVNLYTKLNFEEFGTSSAYVRKF